MGIDGRSKMNKEQLQRAVDRKKSVTLSGRKDQGGWRQAG